MLAQFFSVKEKYPDCLLFFRLGDFYEMFFDDAIRASQILDITLTRRGKTKEQDIPMCGVPYHAAESYIARLIKAGQKVAICDQLESPEDAKKRGYKAVVKRDVVRIITPGTLTEDTLIGSKNHNYIFCVLAQKGDFYVAFADISTGDFIVETTSYDGLRALLTMYAPKEVVMPDALATHEGLQELISRLSIVKTLQPNTRFRGDSLVKRLSEFYGVTSLEVFGDFTEEELRSAAGLLEYIQLTQCGQLPSFKPLQKKQSHTYMQMDAATQENLEIFRTLRGERKGSLLHHIDLTQTNGGARLLHKRLCAPLLNVSKIEERLEEVAWAFMSERRALREELREIPDGERALARLSTGRGGPRDLQALLITLQRVEALEYHLTQHPLPPSIVSLYQDLKPLPVLMAELTKALADTVPILARDGGFIRPGYHEALDDLRALKSDGRKAIVRLQEKYSQMTGVSSLKIKFNNVLGYFVEVTSLHQPKLSPDLFIHRQTLVNNMRYTTLELADLQEKLLTADEKSLEIERELFSFLCSRVMEHQKVLFRLLAALNRLDVTLSLGELAAQYGYMRPSVEDSGELIIEKGRHPVVERMAQETLKDAFVPNDCALNSGQYLWLLTGPNMSGKSTYLRQNSLIILLAQMGSFVPAEAARIGVVDRIFSRVGASDDLSRGQSTFMVEMMETATILHQATDRSFVILDEVGRGTATYDGMAIAWAVLEYLHNIKKCRTLFATHFHELTALHTQLDKLACYTTQVKEWKDEVIFLHKVVSGVANRSYGIHVAHLAGLPHAVIKRAGEILHKLEHKKRASSSPSIETLPLFQAPNREINKEEKIIAKVRAIHPDTLSPREALGVLYELKALTDV